MLDEMDDLLTDFWNFGEVFFGPKTLIATKKADEGEEGRAKDVFSSTESSQLSRRSVHARLEPGKSRAQPRASRISLDRGGTESKSKHS
jgi:hypothetical protein